MTADQVRAALAYSLTLRKLGTRYLGDHVQGLPSDPKLEHAITVCSDQLAAALRYLRGGH